MAIKVISKSSIKDVATVALIDALTALGEQAALSAYKSARFAPNSYTNRSYNLHDSYGSAVYINGDLVKDSIRCINRSMSKAKDKHAPSGYEDGVTALNTYFKEAFVVRKRDSFTILVAAAMWYASMVEGMKEGTGFKVFDYDAAKKYIARNLNSVVLPILKKYNMEFLMPTLRKGIGVDNEYYRFGGSRFNSDRYE